MPTYLTGDIAAHVPPMRLKSRATAEYGGACPFCGGDPDRSDRFCIWMGDRPRYWCRQCGRSGPLRDLLDGTTRAAGTSYTPACVHARPQPIQAHIPYYRQLYRAVAAWAQTNLHQSYNPEPLHYLKQRGLHEGTIRDARLGYALDDPRSLRDYLQRQHADLIPYAAEAGILMYWEQEGEYQTHWNLRGCLVFPYIANGDIVDLRTRTFPGKGYKSLPGGYSQRGASFPYGWDTITADCVLITEGEFKALAVSQAYADGTLMFQALAHPGLSYFSQAWAGHLVARGVHAVILGYDSQERPVEDGVTKLAPEEIWSLKHGWTLRRAGLQVMVLRLPLLPGQTKADLDAFIGQYGPGALASVFQTVVPLTTYHRSLPPDLLAAARLPVLGNRRVP